MFYSTFPLKLKENFNYSDIGIFSSSAYPFSLKLIWAPLVDSYYIKSFGLRKTWILITHIICGGLFIVLYYYYDYLMNEKKIYLLTLIVFIIIISLATQDIAIDALALTICGKEVI